MERDASSRPIGSLPRGPALPPAPPPSLLIEPTTTAWLPSAFAATAAVVLCLAAWMGFAAGAPGPVPWNAVAPEQRGAPAALEAEIPDPRAEAPAEDDVPCRTEAESEDPVLPGAPLAVRETSAAAVAAGAEPEPSRRSSSQDGAATQQEPGVAPAPSRVAAIAPVAAREAHRHLRSNGLADAGGARA